MSDLHMEFWKEYIPEWYNTPNDILILAGDIHVGPNKLLTALKHFASISNHVIYIPGNHEYYGYNLNSYDELKLPHNVHFLNPGTVRINDITFIGATMWTDFDEISGNEQIANRYITDFRKIKGFSTNEAKKLFRTHLDYAQQEIDNAIGQVILITHFLPGKHCVHPRWQKQGYPTDQLNSYFAPDPKLRLPSNVTHWLFGHTHDSIDVTLNNVRYISNPYGYHNYEVNPQFNSYYELLY